VKKKYLDIFKKNNTNSRNKNDNSNSDSNENTTNKIDNSNSNDNKDTNNGSNYYSYIIYITIKGVNGKNKIENGCISALEDNENFKFDDFELKELYDKIIKFGIAFCYNHCDVNYDINYGIHFKRREIPKTVYFDDIFRDFNMNNYYFIDKTKMISTLIENKKNLNLRMIKEFFEKPNNENNDGIETFDGLEISKNRKNMREFHKYAVITLNFKKDNLEDYESNISFLKTEISNLFKYHRKNIDFNKLDSNEQRKWSLIEDEVENIQLLEGSITFLMECLNKFYKRKCIVLIDEYDNILTNCFNENYYEKLKQLFKSMFSSIFKSNEFLYFGIVTGCLSLSFKSLFSGPNNFNDCSIYHDSDF
ncbi:hypothetical protein PIROE2DRAFT_18557, partial [Piromyces sp. E2]